MNRFPYNAGHVMVVPTRHSRQLQDLDDNELREMFRYIDYCVRVADRVLHPDGFNVGMNLGRAAGAGIEDHLHVHVVPRWVGDTNFMPVVSDVKVISEHLQTTYQKMADGFAALLAEVQSRA
jgi:ATP adenylyltransferase